DSQMKRLALVLLFAGLFGGAWIAVTLGGQCVVISCIENSHIDGNVPPKGEFDRILRRDLESYFESQGHQLVTVEYELLRNGPTQAGIAYPKFYAWVRAHAEDAVLEQGAVRLAAIDRTRFRVTDFISEPDIRASPGPSMRSSQRKCVRRS